MTNQLASTIRALVREEIEDAMRMYVRDELKFEISEFMDDFIREAFEEINARSESEV